MLETVREFGLDRLEASGEAETVRRRFAEWCRDLAERLDAALGEADQGHRLDEIEREFDNYRTALKWAIEHDPRLGLRLARALGWFCHLRGYLSECQSWLEQMLALTDESDLEVRARALTLLGIIRSDIGDAKGAQQPFEASHALWLRHGDPVGIAWAWLRLGEMMYERREYLDAEACFQEVLAVFRDHDDRAGAALALIWLGWTAIDQDDRSAARRYFEESLNLYRAIGNTQRVARCHLCLAEIDERDGNLARAEARARQALELFVAAGYPRGIAHAESTLGHIAVRQNELAEAIPYLVECLRRVHAMGSWIDVADMLDGCAAVMEGAHRPELAIRIAAATTALRAPMQTHVSPYNEALREQWLTRARAALGEPAATAAWDEGTRLDREAAVAVVLAFLAEPMAAPATAEDDGTPLQPAPYHLSPRELEVLRLLAEGRTDREIAEALFVSRRTVTTHVTAILTKLGVDSRTAAAALAIRQGLA